MSRWKRNALAVFVGFLIGGVATWASAGSFLANGICWPSANEAFQSWSSQSPAYGFDNPKNNIWVNSLSTYSVDEATGAFNFAIAHYDGLSAPAIFDGAGKFTACPVASVGLGGYVSNDLLFVVAGVVILALGFMAGLKR